MTSDIATTPLGGATPDPALEQAILGNADRLHEGVDYCLQHRSGQRWPEWEKRMLAEFRSHHAHGDACIRYAREVVRGRWEPFEAECDSLLIPCRYLVAYIKSGVISSPCTSFEQRILKMINASAFVYVYARWVLGKRWSAGEKVILKQLKCMVQSLVDRHADHDAPSEVCAIEYALDLRNGSWPALERRVEEGKCTPWVGVKYAEKIRRQPMPTVERNIIALQPRSDFDKHLQIIAVKHYVTMYPVRVPNLLGLMLNSQCTPQLAIAMFPLFGQNTRLKPFETILFGMPPCHQTTLAIITYTTMVFPRRWRKAEKYLFARSRQTSMLDALVLYAEKAIKGRWPRIEPKIQNSARHLLEYADRVLKGKLPDDLHARMVFEIWPSHGIWYRDEYIKKYGV